MNKIQYTMLILGIALFLGACGSKTETETPVAAPSQQGQSPEAKEKVNIKLDGDKIGVEYEKQK